MERRGKKKVSLLLTVRYDSLTKTDILAYGVGHFINDLTSTCWFNYLLFFLKLVVRTDAAAAAILAGQITDGIATPLVGHFSDRTQTRLGKRKPWYIGGLVLIVVAFLPTFQDIRYYFPGISGGLEYAYYLFFPSLFNVGWASLQISHMALVPSLTCSRKRRDKLNNLRNTFTFLANLLILLTGFFLFLLLDAPALEFSILSLTALLVGLSFSIFFIVRIDEPRLEQSCVLMQKEVSEMVRRESSAELPLLDNDETASEAFPATESVLDWFRMPSFYLYGLSYMGFRLYVNLFGTLMPFYLIYVMNLAD
jgi:Na+/melibiose symporter-like transporter